MVLLSTPTLMYRFDTISVRIAIKVHETRIEILAPVNSSHCNHIKFKPIFGMIAENPRRKISIVVFFFNETNRSRWECLRKYSEFLLGVTIFFVKSDHPVRQSCFCDSNPKGHRYGYQP